MADKKISELQSASFIDYDNDYTIALRGINNFKIKVGDIINESKSLIPKKVSELENDAEYVTSEKLEAKEYLTQSDAEDKYLQRIHEKTKISDFTDDINIARKKDLDKEVANLKEQIDSSVDTIENYIDSSIANVNTTINEINITINETKENINDVLTNDYLKKSELPTKVSVFENDCNYVTVDDLHQHQVATQEEISSMVSEILNSVY